MAALLLRLLLLLLRQLLPAAAAAAAAAAATPSPPECPSPSTPACVAQRWAEATGVGADDESIAEASFVFTLLHVLHASDGELAEAAQGRELVVHAIGASRHRELQFVGRFRRLCEPDLLPRHAASVHVVLVGPDVEEAAHGTTQTLGGSGSCEVRVSTYRGIYHAGVAAQFPTAAAPDAVVGFNVDAYTCSFRPTLQFLLKQKLSTFFSFYHAHEPHWVLELLAEPAQAFGPAAKRECEDALADIRSFAARKAAQKMFAPTLALWQADGPLTPPAEVELLLPAEGDFAENNPYGGVRLTSGKNVKEISSSRTRVQREPNAHLLGL